MKQNILEGLNPAQKKAVCHDKGPLLIIAGAGTGKTTVITRRIAYLVSTKKAKPEEILALTFTDKAAKEMEERVDVLVPYGYTNIWISTFHSFGDSILRENAFSLRISDDFEVLTRPEQVIFFREHLFEMPLEYFRPLGNPARFIEALLNLYSRAKDEDAGPADYEAYVDTLKKKLNKHKKNKEIKELYAQQSEIAACYKKYQALKIKYDKVDFGDQVYLLLHLLRKHPLILKKLQERFKYILVDEFQDTNYTQFELVKLLARLNKNITVVGDDDQSIYKFRGAAISNILNFIDTYPTSRQIVLTQNYRSTQVILESAYKLIRHNNPDRLEVKNKVDKRLNAQKKKGQEVRHLQYDTVSAEADAIAALIREKVGTKKYKYNDFAILVRSNNDADAFLRALNLKNIPWRFSGNQGLYSRDEIRLLISFMRAISDPEDSISLFHLLCSEIYNMNMADLTRLLNFAAKRNRSLHQILKELEKTPELSQELSAETIEATKKILADMEKFLEMSRSATAGALLYQFLKDSGFLKKLSRVESLEDEERVQNIARFFDIIHKFETVVKENKVVEFVKYLDMLINAGDDPATVEADIDIDAVNILTVHKAKGLEFRVVFIVALVMNKFPWPRRKEAIELPDELIKDILPSGEFHIQEERRLFYVAMTRAKEELYLTSSLDYGGERSRKVSQFVFEALDMPAAQLKPQKTKGIEAIERFSHYFGATPAEKPALDENRLINLSFFQIDDYCTCPLKYKFVHILRVPVLRHHTVIYGKALHEAVQFYLVNKMQGQVVSPEQVIEVFANSWHSEGFLTREHEEERFNTGKAALIKFIKQENSIKTLPTYIEKEFSFMLDNNRIIGRWDRIDIADEKAKIIDYKSSGIYEQEDADRRAKESLQLILYALAFQNQFGFMPEAAELHFLESGLIGRVEAASLDLEKIKTVIAEVSLGIRASEFSPKPKYLACQYCVYFDICPYTAQKR